MHNVSWFLNISWFICYQLPAASPAFYTPFEIRVVILMRWHLICQEPLNQILTCWQQWNYFRTMLFRWKVNILSSNIVTNRLIENFLFFLNELKSSLSLYFYFVEFVLIKIDPAVLELSRNKQTDRQKAKNCFVWCRYNIHYKGLV